MKVIDLAVLKYLILDKNKNILKQRRVQIVNKENPEEDIIDPLHYLDGS